MRYVLYALLVLGLLGARLASTSTIEEPTEEASPENAPLQQREEQDELPTFTPTEKVPADSAVSFPVDI